MSVPTLRDLPGRLLHIKEWAGWRLIYGEKNRRRGLFE